MATFGYTTIGGTANGGGAVKGSSFALSEGATLTSISIACSAASGTHSCYGGIYLHSDLSLKATTGLQANQTLSVTADWVTFSISGSLTADTYLLVSEWESDNAQIYYDAGSTNQGHYQLMGFGALPDPMVATHLDRKYSIKVTYTAAGGVSIPVFLHHYKSLKGV